MRALGVLALAILLPMGTAALGFAVLWLGDRVFAGPVGRGLDPRGRLTGATRRLRFHLGLSRNHRRAMAPRLIASGAMRRVA